MLNAAPITQGHPRSSWRIAVRIAHNVTRFICDELPEARSSCSFRAAIPAAGANSGPSRPPRRTPSARTSWESAMLTAIYLPGGACIWQYSHQCNSGLCQHAISPGSVTPHVRVPSAVMKVYGPGGVSHCVPLSMPQQTASPDPVSVAGVAERLTPGWRRRRPAAYRMLGRSAIRPWARAPRVTVTSTVCERSGLRRRRRRWRGRRSRRGRACRRRRRSRRRRRTLAVAVDRRTRVSPRRSGRDCRGWRGRGGSCRLWRGCIRSPSL